MGGAFSSDPNSLSQLQRAAQASARLHLQLVVGRRLHSPHPGSASRSDPKNGDDGRDKDRTSHRRTGAREMGWRVFRFLFKADPTFNLFGTVEQAVSSNYAR
jgi:hypothetical protein